MRLIELSVRNFRGFGSNAISIKLDSDLILFFGPNGFGKTSLAEAIEWLFYGSTKRRQQGETYSKNEYLGTYANAHEGRPIEVEAIVDMGGRQHRLKRQLLVDTQCEGSTTFVDGTQVGFSSVGVTPIEAVYPIVAQHSLQTFIHTKPKDRRDAIGAALGLGELTTLKSALDSARLSFQRTPPHAVSQARRDLAANLATLASIPEAAELVQRWQRAPMQIVIEKDIEALLKASTALCREACITVESALAALRVKRTEASKAVFDTTKLSPSTNIDADLEVFDRTSTQTADAVEGFEKALVVMIAAVAVAYGAALLDFWNRGLTLVPTGDTCPMCEAPTLTAARRAELQKRLADGSAAITRDKTFTDATEKAQSTLVTLRDRAQKCSVVGIMIADRLLLRNLMQGSESALDNFLVEYDGLVEAKGNLDACIEETEAFLKSIGMLVADASNAPTLVANVAALKNRFAKDTIEFIKKVWTYRDRWAEFERTLSTHISSQDIVAKIDAVGKTLRTTTSMRVLSGYDTILTETQNLIRTVETALQTKQSALLATRGAEVKVLYDQLNPGAHVSFETMEPGTDQLKLHAKSFGVRMPAAANLSECQLNCLGLSVWLMQATTPGSPFDFVVLDDPVQSMDDDHAEAFIASVVPHLMDGCGKQVIVLSHVKRITERLRELNLRRSHRIYHFEGYNQDGPVVTEQVKLAKLLAEIKGAADGNEANREHAVDRLRVLIELFIRELHLQKMGIPVPAQCDAATPGQLLTVYRTISDTTQAEYSGLKDTVGFTDPAHHTQVGYIVPSATNIRPHIDRLETLLKKYGLIS